MEIDETDDWTENRKVKKPIIALNFIICVSYDINSQ